MPTSFAVSVPERTPPRVEERQVLLAVQPAHDADGVAQHREIGGAAELGPAAGSGPFASSSRKSSSRSSANGIAAGRSAVELRKPEQLAVAGALGRLGAEAVRVRGEHRGRPRVGGVLAGNRELQPRHVRRQRAPADGGEARAPDRGADRGANLLGRVVEAADQERRRQLEPVAQRRRHSARVAVRVDDQPREVRRQEHEVVERRHLGVEVRLVRHPQPAREDRALLRRVGRPGARHDEDVLARADVVVRRARLGVAAVAARGLALRRLGVVRRLDLRELDGVRAEAVERLVLAREHLPQRVLRDGHATRLERRAVGQRVAHALQELLHVVRGAVPVVHRHDDRRGAEGAVTGGEDVGVGRAHRVPVRAHALAAHQPALVEVLADRCAARWP